MEEEGRLRSSLEKLLDNEKDEASLEKMLYEESIEEGKEEAGGIEPYVGSDNSEEEEN